MEDPQKNDELLREIEALKKENTKLVNDAKEATKKEVAALREAMSAMVEKIDELEERFNVSAKERELAFKGETILLDVSSGYIFSDAHGNVKFRSDVSHDEKIAGDKEDREFQKLSRGLPGDRRPVMPGFSH
jgi:hypothetical protein